MKACCQGFEVLGQAGKQIVNRFRKATLQRKLWLEVETMKAFALLLQPDPASHQA